MAGRVHSRSCSSPTPVNDRACLYNARSRRRRRGNLYVLLRVNASRADGDGQSITERRLHRASRVSAVRMRSTCAARRRASIDRCVMQG